MIEKPSNQQQPASLELKIQDQLEVQSQYSPKLLNSLKIHHASSTSEAPVHEIQYKSILKNRNQQSLEARDKRLNQVLEAFNQNQSAK